MSQKNGIPTTLYQNRPIFKTMWHKGLLFSYFIISTTKLDRSPEPPAGRRPNTLGDFTFLLSVSAEHINRMHLAEQKWSALTLSKKVKSPIVTWAHPQVRL